MQRIINCLFLAMIPLYLFELLCAGIIIVKSLDCFEYTYYAATVFMLLWTFSLILIKQMTTLQNTIFLAITICNLCVIIPCFLCIVLYHDWTVFPPVLFPLAVALSPFVVSLAYFPPNRFMAHWELITVTFLLIFSLGLMRGYTARKTTNR